MRLRANASLLLIVVHACAAAGCSTLADPNIEYACARPEAPYVEEFNGDLSDLLDSCWLSDNFENGEPIVDGEDLLIRPRVTVAWDQSGGQAPMVYRRIEGEFVIAGLVEAATGIGYDHCLAPEDAAGLVVRRSGPELAWSTLTIQPSDLLTACNDMEVTARAEVRSFGVEPPARATVDGIGQDAEADIAICRVNGHLRYYYRDITKVLPEEADTAWKLIEGASMAIGDDPVDVGATTVRTDTYDVEGHFNWLAFPAEGVLEGDTCLGALEQLSLDYPEGI